MKTELRERTEEEAGDHWGPILRVTWDSGEVEEHHDGGEPEDQTFWRDWSWVQPAIDRAYREGLAAGRDLQGNKREGSETPVR